jgi:hypothetical protein
MWIPSRAFLDGIVNALGNSSMTLHTAVKNSFEILITNEPAPTVNTVLADLTEATYTGYLRQVCATWTGPFVAEGDYSLEVGPAHHWQPTDTITLNTITGHALVGDDSVTLLATEMFDQPIGLSSILTGFDTVPRIGLPGNVLMGQSLIGE